MIKIFRTTRGGIIGIFVLLKFEIELEIVTSDIRFDSINSWQI